MKTSVSFTKLDIYFFIFLAVFVAPNFEAITKNRFNYGVKYLLAKIYQIDPVPRSPSYGVYISQLIRFARVCSNVDDFNNRNLFLTAKLLT